MATKYKTINVPAELHEEFNRMADSYDLSQIGLMQAMMNYFKATKADPRDPKADNPTDAIKALDKRLISFIRQQEKQILKPMHDNMVVLQNNGIAQMENVNNYMKAIADVLDDNLLKDIRLSHIRTIGGAIRPELLTEEFKKVYESVKHTRPGVAEPKRP